MSDAMLCPSCGQELETISQPKGVSIHPLIGCEECNRVFTMKEGNGRIVPCKEMSYKDLKRKITGCHY